VRRREFMAGAAALATPLPALAFERVGDRRSLVFSGGQPVPVLDPHVRYDWSTRMMQQGVYDALLKYVGNPAKTVPWLAERWETSEDARVWTFHLVGNAKFHNGDPVDAEAVRFSFQRALRLNKGVAWMLKSALDPAGIEAVDPRTVRITLKEPYGPFLSFIPLWFIVNPKQVTGDDDGQKFLTDGDAGSGPFRIKRWDGQAVMALDAVPDYWKGWPMPEPDRPAGVIYRVIREPAPRKAALQRGEIDIVTEMTPDDYDQLAKVAGIEVTDDKGMTPFTIQMNTQKGPTTDLNFRKALAYAFDYDALLQIENGAAKLLDSPFPDAMTFHATIATIPRRDLDKAHEYLAKTPWAKGGISLDYTYVAGLEVERRIGLALLESLQPLGITVNVVAQPWPTLTARGAKPETASDLVAVYVTPVSPDPDVLASQYASSAHGQFWGMHQLSDPQLDDMVAKARLETDQAKRGPQYEAIQQRIVDLQPAIFGMMENRKWAMRNYVKGFDYCPLRLTGEVDLYTLYAAKA
jgi:peptide/nickel transport system substrate-binding protein